MVSPSAVALARFVRRYVPAVVFVLAVTACSSDSTGTSNPSSAASSAPGASETAGGGQAGGAPDPCTLATAAEVAANFGEQFDAGKPSGAGSQKGCLFVQPGGGIDSVYIYVASGSDAAIFYSTNRSAYDSTDITGLGDKAFVSNDGGQFGVQQGSVTVLIHLVGFTKVPPATLKSKQEAFARVVLGHLH